MRRSLQQAAVLATSVLAVALAAACTGTTTGSSPGSSTSGAPVTTASGGGSASPEDVAWVDDICGELVEMGEQQRGAPPNLDDLRDPSTAITAVTEYIDANIDNVEQTVADLKAVGPSPIEGGDETVAAVERGLTDLQATYEATREQIVAADPGDQQAVRFAILTALGGLNEGGTELRQAFDSVQSNKELASAVEQSQTCQQLGAAAEAAASSAVVTAVSIVPTT